MNCPLCGATHTEQSTPGTHFHLKAREDVLRLGFTNLHAGIRFMEFLLHVSYMLDLKKPICLKSVPSDVASKARRQELVRKRLFEAYGIIVDARRKVGGTTNDGNTARIFFSDPDRTARLLDLPEDLVRTLDIIWKILRCKQEVDPVKVKEVCDRFKRVWFDNFMEEPAQEMEPVRAEPSSKEESSDEGEPAVTRKPALGRPKKKMSKDVKFLT